ncbi:unnamed protein product, partial [Haemonchus placei]|uniref:Secreted protein n=1 Tax=Haemonchus placei TaxID=6290 RepID=A0A0N4XBP3_HAEPC
MRRERTWYLNAVPRNDVGNLTQGNGAKSRLQPGDGIWSAVIPQKSCREMTSKQNRYVAFVSLLMLLLDGGFALTDRGRVSLAKKSTKVNTASFPGGGSILEKNRIEGVSDYLYEGDINLTEEQLTALETKLSNSATRQKRQASKVA